MATCMAPHASPRHRERQPLRSPSFKPATPLWYRVGVGPGRGHRAVRWLASLTAGLVAAVLPAAPAWTQDGGAWLDAGTPAGWNVAGAAVPAPPRIDGQSLAEGRCGGQARRPAGAEDRAVMAAGWVLVGPLQVYDDVSVIGGAVAADGMCRWLGYQVFVFAGGRLAGTASPAPRDARTDGMPSQVRLYGPDLVVAEFLRYRPTDPLCCASRASTVSYRIERGPGGPVLVPGPVSTQDLPRP